MSNVGLVIGYVSASGMAQIGLCNLIKPIRNLNELFANLSITANAADIHAFFERPMSNPAIFTNIGVCGTPTKFYEKNLDGLIHFWKNSEYHVENGGVLLLFKDDAWHILSRVPLCQTDDLVPLNDFLYEHYKNQGMPQEQLDRLGLTGKNPFIPVPNSNEIKPFFYNAA